MLKYFCSPPQLKSICTWETHDKGPSLLPHGSEWEDMWQENELCARNAWVHRESSSFWSRQGNTLLYFQTINRLLTRGLIILFSLGGAETDVHKRFKDGGLLFRGKERLPHMVIFWVGSLPYWQEHHGGSWCKWSPSALHSGHNQSCKGVGHKVALKCSMSGGDCEQGLWKKTYCLIHTPCWG